MLNYHKYIWTWSIERKFNTEHQLDETMYIWTSGLGGISKWPLLNFKNIVSKTIGPTNLGFCI